MPTGLGPAAGPHARVLVLGSLPGEVSLARQEYYANPRNAFWDVAEQLLGISRQLPYPQRTELLRARGVALWDVLRSAERAGSLDASIVRGTEVPNDIAGFLREHPEVELIALNGAAAEKLFARFARPGIDEAGLCVRTVRLPSTSPANARYSPAQKVAAWGVLGEVLGGAGPAE